MTQPPYPALARSPLDLGTTFSAAFALMRKQFWTYLALALVPALLALVILAGAGTAFFVSLVLPLTEVEDPEPGRIVSAVVIGLLILLLCLILIILVQVKFQAMTMAVAEANAQGRTRTMSEASERTRGVMGRYLPIFGVWILFFIAAMVALGVPLAIMMASVVSHDSGASSGAGVLAVLLFLVVYVVIIIAAVLLSVRLLFAMPVAALEADTGQATLSAAWSMTRSHFWRLFGYLIVFGIAVSMVQSLAAVPLNILTARSLQEEGDSVAPSVVILGVILGLVLELASVVASIVQQLYIYVMYVDTHRRHRGDVGGYGGPFGGHGHNPYGHNPYGHNPYGHNPYGHNPYGQNPADPDRFQGPYRS